MCKDTASPGELETRAELDSSHRRHRSRGRMSPTGLVALSSEALGAAEMSGRGARMTADGTVERLVPSPTLGIVKAHLDQGTGGGGRKAGGIFGRQMERLGKLIAQQTSA